MNYTLVQFILHLLRIMPMARKKKAKAKYAKKIRKQADARHDSKIAVAREEMMKNKKRVKT